MKSIKDAILFLLLVCGICSCAHQHPAATTSSDSIKFVVVAHLPDPGDGWRIGSVLEKAGIHCIIYGSNSSDIAVPTDERTKATLVLKQDAQVHKYEITFN
jgi:hypothetical protein